MFLFQNSLKRIGFNVLCKVNFSSVTKLEKANAGFEFKGNFSNEDQIKILNTLNTSNTEQLLRFSITQSRVKSLENWKTKKGPFKSLNEVLEVEGLGEKVLERLCESIITEKTSAVKAKPSNNNSKRIKQIVIPPVGTNVLETIKSAVGIHLGPTGISWAKINREDNSLINWNYENFSALPNKLLPVDTFNLALDSLSKIPVGDVYVFEGNQTMSPQGQTQTATITSYTHQLELSSMLLALLNTSQKHNMSLNRLDSEVGSQTILENQVYYIRSKIPARMFKILMGHEKVSTIIPVSQIIENNVLDLPCSPIIIDEDLRYVYNTKTPANKEILGQALILIISFMELCVYRSQKSITAITTNRR